MATLVLTAVGSAVGGPLGGAIGAFIGQQIDQNILFKPKGQEGPRLQELALQTSSYGTQIPQIFGKMRVAGTVIWATDLKETKATEGGKGRPKTTTYSYSACFAVGLSSRSIQNIGRIWADGKIFRGSAGDFKTSSGFRFYPGEEDQPLDGLIAAAETESGTPAYRGMAVAIFEDMELADYGNRIPSLTFELIADDGSVSLTDIVDHISDHRVDLSSDEHLHGFSASGANRRDAIAVLSDQFQMSFSVGKDKIYARSRMSEPAEIGLYDTGNLASDIAGKKVAEPEYETLPEAKIPRQLVLRYYEPNRDYQSGLQNSFRPGQSRVVANIDFPAAMGAAQAKKISQNYIWHLYQERSSHRFYGLLGSQLNRPGSFLQYDGQRNWCVRNWELRDGTISLSTTSIGNGVRLSESESEEGRSISDVDALAGTTKLVFIDLPFAPDFPNQASLAPQLFAVAAGEAGWRNADLYQALPDGSVGAFITQIPSPAIIGVTDQPLPPSSPHLLDYRSSFSICLHNGAMTLSDADQEGLSAGKNIAMVGREFIQFETAKPLGNARYSLSGLRRGLGGTEQYIDNHNLGEDFVLIEPASAASIASNFFNLFQTSQFLALGRDDKQPVAAAIEAPGRALKPWSPIHMQYEFKNSGDLELSWIRRSRAGSSWSDFVDIPLAEEAEEYQVVWQSAEEVALGSAIATAPQFLISGQQLLSYQDDGINVLKISVRQRGQHTVSESVNITIDL